MLRAAKKRLAKKHHNAVVGHAARERSKRQGANDEGAPRVDLGTFNSVAAAAVISVPGAVNRSASTLVELTNREPSAYGHISVQRRHYGSNVKDVKEYQSHIAPMLKEGTLYEVLLIGKHASKSAEQEVVNVDGKDLQYVGTASYEYWHSAVQVSERG
jgi:hypothetical protein